MPNDDDPPIRLILSALFLAARISGGHAHETGRPDLVRESVADADELLKQVGPPA
jgi:hypothetical protein